MNDTLGQKLKNLRENRHLKLKQVADYVGMSGNTVCSYELDVRQPSYDTLLRLANLYNVSTDYLLGKEKEVLLNASGLTEKEIGILTELIEDLSEKNKKIKKDSNGPA